LLNTQAKSHQMSGHSPDSNIARSNTQLYLQDGGNGSGHRELSV
jgi:hypothetical protein